MRNEYGTTTRLLPIASLLVAMLAAPAWALINASFTPVDLVKQADRIVVVNATADPDNDALTIRTSDVLKGKDPNVATLDVSAMRNDEEFAWWLEDVKTFPAVLMLGDFGKAKADARGKIAGALHVGRNWYGLEKTDAGYKLVADPLDLKAVWDGGHKPLVRAVQYVLRAPRPEIRATSGVRWKEVRTLRALPGKTNQPAVAMDTDRPTLYWPSDKGDWLMVLDANGQIHAAKLPASSLAVTRADLDADGTLDWVATDGREIYLSDAKGTRPLTKLEGAVDLSSVSVTGRPAVMAVAPGGPILLTMKDGKTVTTPLLAKPLSGVRQACMLHADGDGVPDVLIATDRKLLLCAGQEGGRFAKPTEAAELYDIGLTRITPADFDGDGAMDLLLTGPAEYGVILLAGDGKGQFQPVLGEGGELGYHGTSATTTSGVCDINNDGLVDLYVVPTNGAPKVFFNRGFRSFGLARSLDLSASDTKGAEILTSDASVQSAIAMDVNADGAQDMLCVADGKLVAILRKPRPRDIGVTLRLPSGEPGPVSVWAIDGKRTTAGRVIAPGRGVFIGKTTKGPLTLRTTWPGGQQHSQRAIVIRPASVILKKGQK
jgi:hypothetical protein